MNDSSLPSQQCHVPRVANFLVFGTKVLIRIRIRISIACVYRSLLVASIRTLISTMVDVFYTYPYASDLPSFLIGFLLFFFSRRVARNHIPRVKRVKGTAMAINIQKSFAKTIVDVDVWKVKRFIPRKL